MTYQRPGVYISERTLPTPIASTGSANAAGAALGVFEKGPTAITLVTSWYDFVKKFGNYSASYPTTFGVSQFFRTGGTELYVGRVLASDAAAADVDITDSSDGAVGTFTAKNLGADGNNLRVTLALVSTGIYNLTVSQEYPGGDNATIADDLTLETWNNVVFNDVNSSDYVGTVLQLSEYVSFTLASGGAARTPELGYYPLTGGTNSASNAAIAATDYDAVLAKLALIDRPFVLFSPEAFTSHSSVVAKAINTKLSEWAELHNSFAVLDTEPALLAGGGTGLEASEAITYAGTLTATSYSGVYYPHVYIADPIGRSSASLRKLGPASSVAGLFMLTDRQAGPFKAPAGIRANLSGVVAPEVTLSSSDLDALNSSASPVNAIRALPGAGTVVMGARTLKQTSGTADRYVSMRRSLNYLRKRINDLTQFAVFENNNETLWAQVRTVLSVFLNEYRNQGGLRGATPADAYFIKCDAENNTATDIANGIVNIEVGVALEYPAEFVVITLSQKSIN